MSEELIIEPWTLEYQEYNTDNLNSKKIIKELGIKQNVFNSKKLIFRKMDDYEKIIKEVGNGYANNSYFNNFVYYINSYKQNPGTGTISNAQSHLKLHYDQKRKDFFKEYPFKEHLKKYIEEGNESEKIKILKQYFSENYNYSLQTSSSIYFFELLYIIKNNTGITEIERNKNEELRSLMQDINGKYQEWEIKNDDLNQKKQKQLETNENDFKNSRIKYKEEIDNIKNNLEKLKEDLNNQVESYKNQALLSAPIEHLYNHLEIYTGSIYYFNSKIPTNTKEKEIKYKEAKENKAKQFHSTSPREISYMKEYKPPFWKFLIAGKIRINMFLSIIWSVLSLATILGVAFSLPGILEKTEGVDSWKLILIGSSITTTFIFLSTYVLRIFVRNWVSASHIAEEIRYKISIAKVYMAMINDKTIDDSATKKQLLSYIFEKIETGLIKHTEDKDTNNIKNILSKT